MHRAIVTGAAGQDGSYLAERVLGWKPEVPLDQLVTMMVDAQVRKLKGSGA